MLANGAVSTIRDALGLVVPRQLVTSGAPLSRFALFVIVVLAALVPATALADGQDILDDFNDNGQIDECYTRAEFQEAQELVRDDERQYGALAEVLAEAQIQNLERPGEPCGAGQIPTEIADADSGGSNLGLFIGLGGAVLIVAIGAGIWARRGAGGEES